MNAYNVPTTGIYVYSYRKGHLGMYDRNPNYGLETNNVNCFTIGEKLFEGIWKDGHSIDCDISKWLISLTVEEVIKNYDYSYEEWYESCSNNCENCNLYEPYWNDNLNEEYLDEIDDWYDFSQIIDFIHPIPLKRFDPLRVNHDCLVECNLNKIKQPKHDKKCRHNFVQTLELYADDSKKTIKSAILGNEVFFEDEFKNGDKVYIWGDYDPNSDFYIQEKNPFIIKKMVKIQSSPKTKNKPKPRNSTSYNTWRDSVIKRDGFCQCCGGDKYLEAHHIFSYNDNESLRENPENGIVLCKWCHKKYHSYYGKKANPLDLVDFLNRFGTKRDD